MMMPANYSVVAENEMTYVVGGGIADILAPMMTAQNVQNIVVNTITMVGSYFVNSIVGNGLYNVFTKGFTGDWSNFKASDLGFLNVTFEKDTVSGKADVWGNLGNLALNTVGVLSAIYTMGVKAIGPSFEGNIGKFAPAK